MTSSWGKSSWRPSDIVKTITTTEAHGQPADTTTLTNYMSTSSESYLVLTILNGSSLHIWDILPTCPRPQDRQVTHSPRISWPPLCLDFWHVCPSPSSPWQSVHSPLEMVSTVAPFSNCLNVLWRRFRTVSTSSGNGFHCLTFFELSEITETTKTTSFCVTLLCVRLVRECTFQLRCQLC